jgi:hypothetical protein
MLSAISFFPQNQLLKMIIFYLTFLKVFSIIYRSENRAISSDWLERLLDMQEVSRSNRLSPTM